MFVLQDHMSILDHGLQPKVFHRHKISGLTLLMLSNPRITIPRFLDAILIHQPNLTFHIMELLACISHWAQARF